MKTNPTQLLRFLVFILLMGCGKSEGEGPDGDLLTWNQDIQPIVEQHCVRCHNANGTGVGDFQRFDEVSAFAEVMLEAMESGQMPPPASDPNCQDYTDSDILFMSSKSRALFAEWIAQGKVEGDPADVQTYDNHAYVLDDANLELLMSEPYTASFTNTNDKGNEYRCFALDPGQDKAFYITAMHPIVQNLKMSHHVIIGTAKQQDLIPGSEDPQGASCIENGGNFANGRAEMLGGWAPGMSPYRLPEGVGIRVEPDDYIIIQMHYYQGGLNEGELTDQSGIALKISDTVEREAFIWTFGIDNFLIPAGAESHTDGDSFSLPSQTNLDLTVWSMLPHMHAIGSGYSMNISHDSGETCVVQSDGYDFDNQQTYVFKEPLNFKSGDTVSWSCTWNNSTSNPDLIYNPPIDIAYGEGSDDEMCFFFGLVSE